MELTQKIVDAARYEGHSYTSRDGRKRWTRHELRDDSLPGFGLRITSTNRKSFFVSYRAGKRKRTKTLGTAAKLSLDEARRRAVNLLESVTGEPPPETVPQPEIQGVETVAQLADAYLENHLKSTTPSWFADQRLMRTHIKPAMGRKRVAEVTQTDLANLRSRVTRRFPADARRLKGLLAGMFDWAAEHDLWSKTRRRAGARKRRPRPAPEAATAATEVTDRAPEPAPEPPRSSEELTEALRRAEEERLELSARLEEVSSSGAEMLARIHEQVAVERELEAKLARSRRDLHRARAETRGGPDPEKTAHQLQTLRQSVEQLMASLKEANAEREGLAEQLVAAEARAADQARRIAALARSRDELEKTLREEERKAAIRRVQRHRGEQRRQLGFALVLGAIAGAMLALVLQMALGGNEEPATVAAAIPSASGEPAPPAAASGAGGPRASMAVEGGAAPAAAPRTDGEPTTPVETTSDAPDLAAVEAAVRAWAEAWSDQRVDDYLAAYSPDFAPADGLGRGEWAAQRRSRILRPSSIQVTLGALSVTVTGPDRVSVSFEQSYETPTYGDRVVKNLELARQDGGWRIIAERSG